MKILFRTLLLLILTNFVTFASTNTLKISAQIVEPFYYLNDNGKVDGRFYHVIKATCLQEGLICDFGILPFRRALKSIKSGSIDMTAPLAKIKSRESFLDFSNPIFKSGYSIFVDRGVYPNISKIHDIRGLQVGVHSPSSTERSLKVVDNKYDLQVSIQKEPNIEQVLDKFRARRYGVLYMNEDMANFKFRKWAITSRVKKIDSFNKKVDYRIGYSKANRERPALKRFKKGLKKYLKSYEYKKYLSTIK